MEHDTFEYEDNFKPSQNIIDKIEEIVNFPMLLLGLVALTNFISLFTKFRTRGFFPFLISLIPAALLVMLILQKLDKFPNEAKTIGGFCIGATSLMGINFLFNNLRSIIYIDSIYDIISTLPYLLSNIILIVIFLVFAINMFKGNKNFKICRVLAILNVVLLTLALIAGSLFYEYVGTFFSFMHIVYSLALFFVAKMFEAPESVKLDAGKFKMLIGVAAVFVVFLTAHCIFRGSLFSLVSPNSNVSIGENAKQCYICGDYSEYYDNEFGTHTYCYNHYHQLMDAIENK